MWSALYNQIWYVWVILKGLFNSIDVIMYKEYFLSLYPIYPIYLRIIQFYLLSLFYGSVNQTPHNIIPSHVVKLMLHKDL